MIKEIKQKGFQDGFAHAKKAKEENKSKKAILKMAVDDKQIAKQFMKEYKLNREKAFRFAVIYSFGYDVGILEAVYSE